MTLPKETIAFLTSEKDVDDVLVGGVLRNPGHEGGSATVDERVGASLQHLVTKMQETTEHAHALCRTHCSDIGDLVPVTVARGPPCPYNPRFNPRSWLWRVNPGDISILEEAPRVSTLRMELEPVFHCPGK